MLRHSTSRSSRCLPVLYKKKAKAPEFDVYLRFVLTQNELVLFFIIKSSIVLLASSLKSSNIFNHCVLHDFTIMNLITILRQESYFRFLFSLDLSIDDSSEILEIRKIPENPKISLGSRNFRVTRNFQFSVSSHRYSILLIVNRIVNIRKKFLYRFEARAFQ